MKKLLFFASAVALLASCSQDLTGDYAPSMKSGKTKIVAYNSVGDNTRTHLDENFEYDWDAGDAIGLFSAEAGDDTNAYFGYTGNNMFEGDLEAVAGETYYAYYPWSRDVKLEDDSHSLKMYINAKQKYNHKNSSFAATEAPAVAYGVAPAEGEEFKLTFTNLATYIRVPLVGVGTVNTLTLAMGSGVKGSTAREKALNGSFVVDFEGDDLGVYEMNGGSAARKYNSITLDCGKGVKLDPKEPSFFWFVIPAGVEIEEGEYANFWVNFEGDFNTETTPEADFSYAFSARTTKNNQVLKLANYDEGDKAKEYAYTWYEGDAYVIIEKFDFIKYAYAATYGVAGAPKEMLDTDGNLRPAMIIENLDFTGYDPDKDIKLSQADQYTDFDKAVVKAYTENGGVATIGEGENAVAYSIEGNVKGEAAVITDLNVTGDKGIFGVSNKPVVKNITLNGFKVNSTNEEAVYVSFLMDAFQQGNTATGTFEGLTVKGGELTAANTAAKTALVRQVYINEIANDKKLPVTVDGDPTGVNYLAYVLYVNKKDVTTISAEYVSAEKVAFATVVSHNSGHEGVVNIAAGEAAAKKFIDAITSTNASRYFSVVTGYDAEAKTVEKSYWTGVTPAAAPASTDYLTAEGLAYYVKERGTVTLTNNIDLMNGDWKYVVNADQNKTGYLTVDSKQPATKAAEPTAYTIENVKLVIAEDEAAEFAKALTNDWAYLSLFGYRAHVSNVVVKNLEVSDVNLTKKSSYIAGLAHTGTANNVKVEGAKINATIFDAAIVKAHPEYYANYTGVILAYTDAVDYCEVTNSTVAGKMTAGYVAGVLDLNDNKQSTFTFNKINVGAGNKAFGEVSMVQPADTKQSYTTIVFTDFTGVAPDKTNIYLNSSATVASHAVKLKVGKDAEEAMFTIEKKK